MYKTKDFVSPTGGVMLFAIYDTQNKQLEFKIAKKYLYPQDSKHMIDILNVESFIKENKNTEDTVEEANKYLKSLGINEELIKI